MDVCGVVLAAGEGRRLRPLTDGTPKALCPVGNVPLLESALGRSEALGLPTAVNACYLGEQVVEWVGERAHVAVEPDGPLGTAGGLGNLRGWIDGRAALVGNADAYLSDGDISAILDGWDGESVRLLGVDGPPHEFGTFRFAGYSLIPWDFLRHLTPEPADLVRAVWRPAERADRLDIVRYSATYLDTGTPADYLKANLHAAGGVNLIAPTATVTGKSENSVIGEKSEMSGEVRRTVVWPHATVGKQEKLRNAIRVGTNLTVQVG